MTDQLSNLTGNIPGGGLTGIGGFTGTLQGGINKLTNMGSSYLDKILPPEQRENLKERITKFVTERPILSSFLVSQIALSGGPLALFVLMTVTVFIFALLAALIIGLIGVLLFILGALGVALFVLLPTLFVTTFLATALWLGSVGTYFIVKWFNQKKVPGIHLPLKDGLLEQTGLKDLPFLQDRPQGAHQPHSSDPKSSKLHGHDIAETEKPSAKSSPKSNGSAPRSRPNDDRMSDVSEADRKRREHIEKPDKLKKVKEPGKTSADEAVQQVTDPLDL